MSTGAAAQSSLPSGWTYVRFPAGTLVTSPGDERGIGHTILITARGISEAGPMPTDPDAYIEAMRFAFVEQARLQP